MRRCPQCGKGKLFQGFLKQADRCSVCGEDFSDVRADDMTSWLTILVVGIVLAPLIAAVELNTDWPEAVSMAVWVLVALGLMLLVLPRAKGFLLALIWRMRRSSADYMPKD